MARLKRVDWLEQGLQILAKEGVDTLTIDYMCQKLGVTKGSFYHHFQNRQTFLEGILQYWEDKYTHKFIEISDAGATPQEKMTLLQEQVIHDYGTYEVNIRAWAQVDPLARDYQERVDQQRLAFLIDIQKELFDSEQVATTMGHLQYTTLIGSAQMMPNLTKQDLQDMYHLLTELAIHMQTKDDET